MDRKLTVRIAMEQNWRYFVFPLNPDGLSADSLYFITLRNKNTSKATAHQKAISD